jgi:hypothetical protein
MSASAHFIQAREISSRMQGISHRSNSNHSQLLIRHNPLRNSMTSPWSHNPYIISNRFKIDTPLSSNKWITKIILSNSNSLLISLITNFNMIRRHLMKVKMIMMVTSNRLLHLLHLLLKNVVGRRIIIQQIKICFRCIRVRWKMEIKAITTLVII